MRVAQYPNQGTHSFHVVFLLAFSEVGALEDAEEVSRNSLPTFKVGSSELVDTPTYRFDLLVCQHIFCTVYA
jgi:hypothetical protein